MPTRCTCPLLALRVAAFATLSAGAVACGGPDFSVAGQSEGGVVGADARPDVDRSPIICNNCPDPPGRTQDDGGDGAEGAAEDATLDGGDVAVEGAPDNATLDGGGSDASGDGLSGDPPRDASEAAACPTDQLACDGECVPSDVHHCGSCGSDCTTLSNVTGPTSCASGQCSFPASSCAAGWVDCNGNAADGCETDVTKPAHCGSCSTACGGGTPVCSGAGNNSSCVSGCSSSAPTLCSGTCVDTTTSASNCGTCGNACATGSSCVAGVCVPSCAGATPDLCGTTCVNVQADSKNCGTCGHACTVACSNGACVMAVSLGAIGSSSTMCAVLSDGTMRCWGSNQFGQVGNGTTQTGVTLPSIVPGLSGVTAASAGQEHACAVVSGGNIECWGDNSSGELGNGADCPVGSQPCPASDLSPGLVSGLTGAIGVLAGGSGRSFYSCAVVPGGAVYCWGDNQFGEVGRGGSTNPVLSAIAPATVNGVIALSNVGGQGVCALLGDGTVSCWGSGNAMAYLLNLPTQTNATFPPTQVPGMTGVTDFTVGGASCGVVTGGVLECWGGDNFGQVGDGLSTSWATGVVQRPTPVAGLSGLKVTAASAAAFHTCALISDGTVRCWGDNGAGELGIGSVDATGTPLLAATTPVVGLAGAIQIAAADAFTCALLSSGAVECWGANQQGQLGNGTTSTNPQPTPGAVHW